MKDFNISKKEWKFVAIFSIIVIIITCVPYLYGYFQSPGNLVFMGHLGTCDCHTYLAWMQQAQEGNLLFKSLYSAEPQKEVLFHPLFLTMGNFARIFNFSNIFTFHLFRIFFSFIFLFTAYIFISYFLKDIFKRGICFLFLIFSSGFGWIYAYFHGHLSYFIIDETIETTTFFALIESPLNLASFALMLIIFLSVLKLFEKQKTKYAIVAGISLFFLSLIHTYDVFIVLCVIGLYILFKSIFNPPRENLRACIKNFFLIFLILMPGILHNYYATAHNEIFKYWASPINALPTPSLSSLALGFGIVFLLALAGTLKIIKNKTVSSKVIGNQKYLFILSWIIASTILAVQPFIHFQRKFTDGLHIPMVILATIGLFFLFDYFKIWWNRKNFSFSFIKIKTLFLTIIIAVSSISNIYLIMYKIGSFDYLIKNPKENLKICPVYLEKTYLEAINWLKYNTSSNETVLSSFQIGNLIPGISGNTVFLGYSTLTLNNWEKMDKLKWFIEKPNKNEEKYYFFKENNISYFLYSPELFMDYNTENFHPENMEYLDPVYRNEKAIIYKIL